MATAETSVLFETRRILNRSKLAGGKAFGEHSAFGVRYFGKKSVPYLGRNKLFVVLLTKIDKALRSH